MRLTHTLILLGSLCITSCSQTVFKAGNNAKVSLNKSPVHNKSVTIDGSHTSYMWGMLPSKNEVDISKLVERNGLKTVSGLRIKTKVEFFDAVLSVASIGFYLPKHFTITAFTDE